MSLFFDILIIAIVIFAACAGYKRGFVRSVLGLVIFFVALFVAIKFSDIYADHLNDTVFMEKVTGEISQSIESVIGNNVDSDGVDGLFEDKPSGFVSIVERFGADMSELEEYYNENSSETQVSNVKLIASYIAKPVASLLSKVIAFLIIFFGVLLVLSIIKWILNLIFKLPVLNAVNKVFGLTFGIIKGVLLAWAASMLLTYLMSVLVMLRPETFSSSMIENTVIVKYIGNINIFNLFDFFKYIA